MRSNTSDNRMFDPRIVSGFRLNRMEVVPADNFVIDADMPTVLRMTPAGAIDVLMPVSDERNKGLIFIINNIGAGGIITLKTSADAAFTTAITIAVSGGWAMVMCTGSPTAALGWEEIASELVVGA